MKKRRLNLYSIVVTVCNYYGITEKQFFSRSRKKSYAQARQIAMYLMRNHGNITTYMGIRDYFAFNNSICNHATVMYAVKEMEDAVDGFNKEVKADIEFISEELCVFRRKYVDIHWFMKINKGEKVHLKYGLEGENTIIWEHDSLETRGNRIYVKGRYRCNKAGKWIDRDDVMYEEDGFVCAGDGHKVFATGNEVRV
tara:strand:+ start:2600 stop:3190 length:591 start_codon:yes stop_codon:yes gene_type:complete